MSDLVIPPTTRLAQARASDPRASAWVSANAGAGKTTVLSHRVIRLLLDGVDPGRILCITFTKAAAANMASRVFGILAQWVTLDDEALERAVAAVDGRSPTRDRRELARRLFACAVETPGGLKIQTIHAFCERLLHLFPFEANVAARFEVLDDLARADLLARAQADVLARADLARDPALAEALARVNEIAGTEQDFSDLLGKALPAFGQAWGEGETEVAFCARLSDALGLAPGESRDTLLADILGGGLARARWPEAIAALEAGSASEAAYGRSLRAAHEAGHPDLALPSYVDVFLKKDGDPRADGKFLTKGFRDRHPGLADALDQESRRVHARMDRLRAADTADRTMALARIARAVRERYRAAKVARGALDFDDLIDRTANLLTRSDAAFVLYKLDQGLDHILVDEAQDTSEPQWAILRAIAEDFVAGEGRTTKTRTIFAVGDPKQSIFSFQGAAPAIFEESRRHFDRRIAALRDGGGGERWRFYSELLTLSFRSSQDVLDAVDAVFGAEENYRSLAFEDPGPTTHVSARPDARGLVELWETEKPVALPEPDAWTKPLDEPEAGSPAVRLARRIAAQVAAWCAQGNESGAPVRPGDILVLVRNRNAVFEAVIRALKECHVPVAGADRLALTRHIAVLDLVALGQASLLPEDDLSLASVLKSPLVGLGEEDLLGLACRREGSLADALARAAAHDPRLAAVQATLLRWRDQARRCGPFGFYAGVLGADRGRQAFLSRLGAEARDAVDEFLRLALEHEQRQVPSLAHFLAALEGVDLTIKRDMEAGRDEVRVMTVHGAKGLEAPIVILADTCSVPDARSEGPLLPVAGADGRPVPAWSGSQALDCAETRRARQAAKRAARDEYVRLLYVAMTRARDRLVVGGFEGSRGLPPGCWYDMVRSRLHERLVEVPAADGRPRLWRSRVLAPEAAGPAPAAAVPATEAPLPAWLSSPAPHEPAAQPPLRPSGALEAADVPTRAVDTPFVREARAAGILVHALLEALPGVAPERRALAAARLAEARGGAVPADRRTQIVVDVLALLAEPTLAPLFGPGSRAEVPLAGSLSVAGSGASMAVSGQIDRLAVTDEAVLIADYKTRSVPPASVADVPRSHVAQLAVYRALVARLYPGRPVRCLIVWTSGPSAMEVPPAVLDAALAQIKAA